MSLFYEDKRKAAGELSKLEDLWPYFILLIKQELLRRMEQRCHIKAREDLNFRSCELLEIVFLFAYILFNINFVSSQRSL